MNPYTYIQNIDALLPEVPERSILSRTVYDDERLRVVLFRFAAGEELSEHTSAYTAVLHFTEGEADLTLGGEAMPAHPGTWVHMTPNLPHSVHARTSVTMLLMMIK